MEHKHRLTEVNMIYAKRAFGNHPRMRVGGYRDTCQKVFDTSGRIRVRIPQRGQRNRAMFASFNYNIPAFHLLRRFMYLPLVQRGIHLSIPGRGRNFTNRNFGFWGLFASNPTHIPEHIFLFASNKN